MKYAKKLLITTTLVAIHADVTRAAIKYAKVGGLTTGNCDTWANACTMDRAMSLTASGDSVWAKKTDGGAYGPIGNLPNGVKIIGGFAGTEVMPSQSNPWTKVTTVDGGGFQCVFSNGNGSSSHVRGFQFTNCRNQDAGNFEEGGAVTLSNSDAVFVNCVFENCTSVRFGAGVFVKGTGSPKFFNCIFRNNGSGSAGSGEDVNVQPLAGGAVYVHSGTPSFTNCLFHGNKAAEGAVVAIADGTPTFTNCTFANNYCKYNYGGGLNDGGSLAVLRNCILWGNTAMRGGSQIFNYGPAVTDASYSDVQGGWTGTGNLNSDPMFVNPSGNDYKLQAGTPCDEVGSGTMPDDVGDLDWDTITTEPVPLDLAGGIRVVFTIDMGAYEIQPGPD